MSCKPALGPDGMEWKGMEGKGREWDGMGWDGMGWDGMEWNGMELPQLDDNKTTEFGGLLLFSFSPSNDSDALFGASFLLLLLLLLLLPFSSLLWP